jgi:hypothetical protein
MSSTTSIAAPAQSPCKAAVATPARVTDPPCIDAATPTAAATKSEPRAPTPVVRAATEVPPRVAAGGTTLAVQRAIDDHCAQLALLRERVARSEAHRGEVDRFWSSLAAAVLPHHRRRSGLQDARSLVALAGRVSTLRGWLCFWLVCIVLCGFVRSRARRTPLAKSLTPAASPIAVSAT